MKIFISAANDEAIGRAIEAVLGRASVHTHCAQDVIDAAKEADSQLRKMRKLGKRPKAVYWATSGAPVAKSYRYVRRGSEVTLLGSRKGWYLVEVKAVKLWPNQGGGSYLRLAEPI